MYQQDLAENSGWYAIKHYQTKFIKKCIIWISYLLDFNYVFSTYLFIYEK